MSYLDEVAAWAGRATRRSLSVVAVLAPEDGHSISCLSPVPIEVGESISECAERAAREAGVGPVVAPRACIGVRSDPTRVVAGPGSLTRQDIEVFVWTVPSDPVPTLPRISEPSDTWVASRLEAFRASGRPAFDDATSPTLAVPDSYSREAHWRRPRWCSTSGGHSCWSRRGHGTAHPAEALMVGDDPRTDVVGAKGAGVHALWVNRERLEWPKEVGVDPDGASPDLLGIVALLRDL